MKFSVSDLKFNNDGLIPAIIQDAESLDVLMMAYMNQESLEVTIKTGKTCFWSRSRNKYWIKGESSGHYQHVKNIYYDCDKDTLLIKVTQIGAACHEGYKSCFFTEVSDNEANIVSDRLFDPKKIYK